MTRPSAHQIELAVASLQRSSRGWRPPSPTRCSEGGPDDEREELAPVARLRQIDGAAGRFVSLQCLGLAPTSSSLGMTLIALGFGPDSPFNFLFHRIGVAILRRSRWPPPRTCAATTCGSLRTAIG